MLIDKDLAPSVRSNTLALIEVIGNATKSVLSLKQLKLAKVLDRTAKSMTKNVLSLMQ